MSPDARETRVYEMVDALGQSARIHTTVDDGRAVVWRQWGAGPLVVLLHGNSGSWTHWVRNIAALAERFTVLVPDLPGHGDSDLPAGDVSCAAFAGLLWRGIDQIAGPDANVALAGFSLGSVLGESMARQQPLRVRQILLLRGAFTRTVPRPPELLRWRGIADPAEAARIHRHNLEVSMFGDAALVDDQAVRLHADNLERCRLDTRPLLASRELEAFLGLRCPVHGIAGERDVYGGGDAPAQGRALREALPQAVFDMIPRAGHWAAYEAAATVNALMVRSLEMKHDQI